MAPMDTDDVFGQRPGGAERDSDGENNASAADSGQTAGDGQAAGNGQRGRTKPRYPLTGIEVAPLAVVVAGVVAGMLLVIFGQWRMGCLVIGAILGVGSLERLLLPPSRVGLLQARSRLLDTLTMLGMAVGICVLAIVVHR